MMDRKDDGTLVLTCDFPRCGDTVVLTTEEQELIPVGQIIPQFAHFTGIVIGTQHHLIMNTPDLKYLSWVEICDKHEEILGWIGDTVGVERYQVFEREKLPNGGYSFTARADL